MYHKKFFPVTILLVLIVTSFITCLSHDKKKTVKAATAATVSKNPSNDSFHVRPLSNIKFERTPQRVKQGEYLTNGILMCFTCHSPRDWDAPGAPPIEEKKGSGGTILQHDSANFIIAPNITPDKETGAGTWTDDMLAKLVASEK
jgi:hypothetical protein